MRIFTLKAEETYGQYSWDVDRIREAVAKQGIVISRQTAKKAWERYSDSMSAGWMCLPDEDEDIYLSIIPLIEEQLEGE